MAESVTSVKARSTSSRTTEQIPSAKLGMCSVSGANTTTKPVRTDLAPSAFAKLPPYMGVHQFGDFRQTPAMIRNARTFDDFTHRSIPCSDRPTSRRFPQPGRFLAVACAMAFLFMPEAARAAVILTVEQVGIDIVATATGSLDLTALTKFNTSPSDARLWPVESIITVGPYAYGDSYSGFNTTSGPFGSGASILAFFATGDTVGMAGAPYGTLTVPMGYISGTPLSGTATWPNRFIEDIGLNLGTYVSTWGSGEHADQFTVLVIPEPSTLALAGLGLFVLAGHCSKVRRAILQSKE